MAIRETLNKLRGKAQERRSAASNRVRGRARERVERVKQSASEASLKDALKQAAAEAAKQETGPPETNREAALAAGNSAQMGAPVNATMDPLSAPEQTHRIAGGDPNRGPALDQLAFSDGPMTGMAGGQMGRPLVSMGAPRPGREPDSDQDDEPIGLMGTSISGDPLDMSDGLIGGLNDG